MANYIVLEMDLNDKWWDKWFVVGGLSIDRSIQLNHYNYFSMSSVYMLTQGDMAKKEFFVRKPQRNLKGFWSKLDIIGVIDDFGGLLYEVYKFCGDNIYCVTEFQQKIQYKDRMYLYIFHWILQEKVNRWRNS